MKNAKRYLYTASALMFASAILYAVESIIIGTNIFSFTIIYSLTFAICLLWKSKLPPKLFGFISLSMAIYVAVEGVIILTDLIPFAPQVEIIIEVLSFAIDIMAYIFSALLSLGITRSKKLPMLLFIIYALLTIYVMATYDETMNVETRLLYYSGIISNVAYVFYLASYHTETRDVPTEIYD